MLKRKTVLVVDYTQLPQPLKTELSEWHQFGNDRLLKLQTSYRLGAGPQTPFSMLHESNFRALYDAVALHERFKGSFEDFLGAYKLRTLYWVACQQADLAGVDEVLVNVSW